jgi:hypothetical protein
MDKSMIRDICLHMLQDLTHPTTRCLLLIILQEFQLFTMINILNKISKTDYRNSKIYSSLSMILHLKLIKNLTLSDLNLNLPNHCKRLYNPEAKIAIKFIFNLLMFNLKVFPIQIIIKLILEIEIDLFHPRIVIVYLNFSP